MSVYINTNQAATVAANNLSATNSALQKSLNRLSSGSKIVSPADDAGGLAVSMKLSAATKRQGAVKTNLANSVSYLQTQDGALKVAGKILERISELKVLFSDPTKGPSDRENYDVEYRQIKAELISIGKEKFNGINLFGSSSPTINLTEQGSSGSTMSLGGVDLLGDSSPLAWQIENSGVNKHPNAVAFGNGVFVGGWGLDYEGGTLATSTDGQTWTTRQNVSGTGIYSVTFGGGQFVAGGNNGHVYTSSDGITWSAGNTGTVNPINDITYDGTQFVGVGNLGTVITSSDGLNWTAQNSGVGTNFSTVANSGSALVAGGTVVRRSTDGVNWTVPTNPPTGASYYNVGCGAGKFVAVTSAGTIFTSTDGNTWSEQTSPVSTSLNAVKFGAGKFVATGDNGVILESSDGVTWTSSTSGTSGALAKGGYGNGSFVFPIYDTSGQVVVSSGSGGNNVATVSGTDSLADITLPTLTNAIQDLASYRAQNGAQQSRIGFATEMLTVNQANLEMANSRITDVDVAEESTNLARLKVLAEAGTAMLSQANQSSQITLKLLGG